MTDATILFPNPSGVNPHSNAARSMLPGKALPGWRSVARAADFPLGMLVPAEAEILSLMFRLASGGGWSARSGVWRGDSVSLSPRLLARRAAKRAGGGPSERTYRSAIARLRGLGLLVCVFSRSRCVRRYRLAGSLLSLDTWTAAARKAGFSCSPCHHSAAILPPLEAPNCEPSQDLRPSPEHTLNTLTLQERNQEKTLAASGGSERARAPGGLRPGFSASPSRSRTRQGKALLLDPEADRRLRRSLARIARASGAYPEGLVRWAVAHYEPSDAAVCALVGEAAIGCEAGRISRPSAWLRAAFRSRFGDRIAAAEREREREAERAAAAAEREREEQRRAAIRAPGGSGDFVPVAALVEEQGRFPAPWACAGAIGAVAAVKSCEPPLPPGPVRCPTDWRHEIFGAPPRADSATGENGS